MNIKTDVMAEMVGQEGFDRLAGHVEAELGEAVFETVLGGFVELVEGEGGGGAAERDAGALGGEDGGVEVALGGGEGAGDGPGAGYVRDVVPDFLRRWGISLWSLEDDGEKGKER